MPRAKPKTPRKKRPAGSTGRLAAFTRRVWHPKIYFLFVAFVGALGVGGALGSWRNLCAGDACPSIAQIKTWEPEQTSKLLSHDGRLLGEIGYERRTPVSINALPEYVPQAVLAIEDNAFYEHEGFSPKALMRAVYGKLVRPFTGVNLGGGSTITQQLARNMFDQIGMEQTYSRKLRELQVAIDLERSYEKDQILEAYLNEIYMGRGYGFQNAARNYLGKNLEEVDVAEAALLAAILNRPGTYDPFRRPENALRRRNLVLNRMAAEGYLSAADAERWKAQPLPESEPTEDTRDVAPYFQEWVRQLLDSRFGDVIYRSGLRVYTTLDVDIQRAAEEAMEKGWDAIEADPGFPHPKYAGFDTVRSFAGSTPYIQGALVALDPASGQVRALVGGRDFEQSKFDRARLARRQAGSSFKPFVYASAIAAGIPASHIVVDAPVVYEQVSGRDWRPSNFSNEFRGPITIREGLYRSINMIAIKLGWEEVGIETVAQTARRMGIQTEIERFPSTTIGAAEVIPIELAEAYAGFATLGTRIDPFPIVKVEDADGNVVWEHAAERTQVLDSLVSRIMVSMLEDVVVRGTGNNAIRTVAGLPYEVAAAGKTGTTNDGTDVWFAGFTPNLLATVWFGMDNPAPIFRLGAGRQATGGALAAPVWGDFMRRVYYGSASVDAEATSEPILPVPAPWPIPPRLTTAMVDRTTGKLASRWCPEEDQYLEYYLPGTEPTEFCDLSGSRRFRIPGIR